MPIVVKAKKGDDNNALIRKFKKLLMIDDIVTIVRDRRYHKNDATKRKEANKSRQNRLEIEAKRRARNAKTGKPVRRRPVRPTRGGERGGSNSAR